ncbi:MAG: AAA family ATPase [Planctomycetaceae bacterium]
MVRDIADSAAPFSGRLEPAAFHPGPPQEEALARLEWLVTGRQRCGIVTGDAGHGKSHLAATAARRLGGLGCEVAVLSLAGLPEGEWIDLVLERLPLDAASRAESSRPWQKLESRLRENALMERPTVIVCDDVDRGPADAAEGIARIASAVESRFSWSLVVATAAPAGLDRVPDALRQRAALRIELVPWTEGETAAFLAWELARHGRSPDVFTAEAAATLARFAGGVPRDVCRLARLALAAAAGDGAERIAAATIERVWRELVPSEPAREAETVVPPRLRAGRLPRD